ncbi:MAG TPA: hypothetical protein VIK81_01400 [Patescibacteria group bacterium]
MFTKFISILILAVLAVTPVLATTDSLQLSANSNYSTTDGIFTPGQTIYVKVITDNPGGSEKVLKLKNNNYSDIAVYQMNKSGGVPYIYTVSFSVPAQANFYSVEVSIKEGSNSQLLIQTFQVENPQPARSVSVQANVSANANVVQKGAPTPTATPTPEVQATQEIGTATETAAIDQTVSFNPTQQEQEEKKSIVERLFSGIFNSIKDLFSSIF